MTDKKCPRCKGRGFIINKIDVIFWSISTLGLIFLFKKYALERYAMFADECIKCNGCGYVLLNKYDEHELRCKNRRKLMTWVD